MNPCHARRHAAIAATLWLTILAARPLSLAAQAPPRPQGEIGLTLGAAFSFSGAESLHHQSWTAPPLAGMSAQNVLAAAPATSFFIGGSYARFFGRAIGIVAGFGYAKNGLAASAGFKTAGTTPSTARALTASPDPSEITAVPIYLGLAVRWTGRSSSLIFSAGPALILHSIVIETEAGMLAASAAGTAGAYRASVSIPDQTWIAAGLHAGLTSDLPIGPSTALFFEVRYFHSPAKSFDWTWKPGSMPGLDDSALSATLDAASAAAARTATRPLAVDPSLLHVSAGLRFRLR